MSYLIVDSNALKDRWNGHLPSITSVDDTIGCFLLLLDPLSPSQKRVGLGSFISYAKL
jgi:hypothetical protein